MQSEEIIRGKKKTHMHHIEKKGKKRIRKGARGKKNTETTYLSAWMYVYIIYTHGERPKDAWSTAVLHLTKSIYSSAIMKTQLLNDTVISSIVLYNIDLLQRHNNSQCHYLSHSVFWLCRYPRIPRISTKDVTESRDWSAAKSLLTGNYPVI